MNKLKGLCLGLCLVCPVSGVVLAQENAGGEMPPPSVLVIQREFLKPGKTGAVHAKSESAFVQAIASANSRIRYLGMDSLSGPSRSLFFMGYPTLAAWEQENQMVEKNPTLAAAIDRASLADGDLLSSYESSVWVKRDEFSAQQGVNVGLLRYMQIAQYKVRPGHIREFEELVKTYTDAYGKALPDARWAMYENRYGFNYGGTFLVITPMKSMAEADQAWGDRKKVAGALGEAGMKRVSELLAQCVESSQTNLFQLNPKISYPREEWTAADPAFWKPKAMVTAKKKGATAVP